MNYKTLIAVAIAGATLLTVDVRAQGEESKADPNSAIKELAELGPGVHKMKYDDNNTLVSCVIVGQARISTALGKAKGVMDAKKKAKLNAEAEFVGWIKKFVTDISQSGDTTEIHIAGSDEEGNPIETAQGKETMSQVTTSQAQGQLRGMRLIGADQDGENGIMTMVYAWKPAYAAAAAGVAGAMNTADAAPGKAAPTGIGSAEGSGSGSTAAPTGTGSSGSGKTPKVKVDTKSRLADGADEFL